MKSLELKAPAKINLSLHVLGRRVDGYHELDTCMQKIDLCDDILISICDGSGIELQCPGSDLKEDSTNLVWKAAERFLEYYPEGYGKRIKIVLRKNIPIAAGLGGGSSDAGAILRGLNELFNAGFSTSVMIEMATAIGADVPFFVVDYHAVRAFGIGEQMMSVPLLADCVVVLVNPCIAVSTKWVFEKYSLTEGVKKFKKKSYAEAKLEDLSLCDMRNDLEKITADRYPVINKIKNRLLALGADWAMMSGSGPTVFGVFSRTDLSGSRFDKIIKTMKDEYSVKVFAVEL